MSTVTIEGATRGDAQMSSIKVIAIVGTVRNTAINGAMKARAPLNTALNEANTAASAAAASHEYSVRKSVMPKADQNVAVPSSEKNCDRESPTEGTT